MELDFTDYNLERYGAIAARKCRVAQPSPAPRRTLWDTIQCWLIAHRIWFPHTWRG